MHKPQSTHVQTANEDNPSELSSHNAGHCPPNSGHAANRTRRQACLPASTTHNPGLYNTHTHAGRQNAHTPPRRTCTPSQPPNQALHNCRSLSRCRCPQTLRRTQLSQHLFSQLRQTAHHHGLYECQAQCTVASAPSPQVSSLHQTLSMQEESKPTQDQCWWNGCLEPFTRAAKRAADTLLCQKRALKRLAALGSTGSSGTLCATEFSVHSHRLGMHCTAVGHKTFCCAVHCRSPNNSSCNSN